MKINSNNVESQMFTVGESFLEIDDAYSSKSIIECSAVNANHHSHGALEEILEELLLFLDDCDARIQCENPCRHDWMKDNTPNCNHRDCWEDGVHRCVMCNTVVCIHQGCACY